MFKIGDTVKCVEPGSDDGRFWPYDGLKYNSTYKVMTTFSDESGSLVKLEPLQRENFNLQNLWYDARRFIKE
jgi:hypothetical protein